MSEERFSDIEDSIRQLTTKVSHLDTSFAEVSVSLKDYGSWVKQLELTIRKLDDTVREMGESHQRIPYDRIQEIRSNVDPIYDMLRKHEENFIKEKDAKNMLGVSVFFLVCMMGLLGMFVDYVMKDVSEDILLSGKENKQLILKNAEDLENHNITKNKVIDFINTHEVDK